MNFEVNLKAAPVGTCLQRTFDCSYTRLFTLFGMPLDCPWGDGKASTEWVFQGEYGAVVTLYDYKATSLYSKDDSLPSPAEFRSQESYDWHIGAKTDVIASQFCYWLVEQLERLDK